MVILWGFAGVPGYILETSTLWPGKPRASPFEVGILRGRGFRGLGVWGFRGLGVYRVSGFEGLRV